MSEENVDRLRRMIDAFNARDFATLEPLFHPGLAWHAEEDQPETFVDVGDCVVMTGRVRGSGRSSGAEVDAEVAGVWRFRDGVVVEHRECQSFEEAMAVAREPD